MNKLVILTVVVFFIIGGMIISASMISEENSEKEVNLPRPNYVKETVTETIEETVPSEDLFAIRSAINTMDNNIQAISTRVNALENAQNQPDDKRLILNNSNDSNSKLNCTVTGYLNPDNTPIPENYAGNLNEELLNGNKKMSLICSYR